MTKRSALLALVAATSGCASDSAPFPSLAPRPIEALSLAEPVVSPVVVAPDATLDAVIATRRERLATSVQHFASDAKVAERASAAARDARAGSEVWLSAQTALAALDNWRAQASALAAEIEQLAQDRAERAAAPYPALDALRDEATAESDQEAATIERLEKALAPA